MTGLWQIAGRSDLSFDDLVRLDFYYLENWSLWLDITILVKTIPGRGGRSAAQTTKRRPGGLTADPKRAQKSLGWGASQRVHEYF